MNTLNLDNMIYVTTSQMAESMLHKLNQRYNTTGNNGGNATFITESAMRALELVRISIQDTFNKEVHQLIKKYTETYFQLALKNIKENLGQSAISEDMLSKMSCAMLENAKNQYSPIRFQKIPDTPIVQPTTNALITLNSQNDIIRVSGLKRTLTESTTGTDTEHEQSLFAIKMTKHAHLDRSSTLISELKPQSIHTINSNVTQKSAQISISDRTILPTRTVGVNIDVTSEPNPHRGISTESEGNVGATSTNNIHTFGFTGRRQIFWNTANISTTTKFVLDVQVNVAFGFGGDSKDRVASKHPELIRYLPDHDDREWLVSQQIIAPHNRNSRFLFLIYDEVCSLTQTYESYRQKSKVDLSLVMTFTLAEFIVEKMKVFFIDLNIKSRGLITNSHTIDSRIKGNIVAHQLGNDNNNSSQLRNALLQGSASPPTLSKVKIMTKQPPGIATTMTTQKQILTSATNIPNIVLRLPSVTLETTAKVSDVNLTAASSVILASNKSKFTSVLSSSHATLTALLNNSKMSINKQSTATSTTTIVSTTIATNTSTIATDGKEIITNCSSSQKSK